MDVLAGHSKSGDSIAFRTSKTIEYSKTFQSIWNSKTSNTVQPNDFTEFHFFNIKITKPILLKVLETAKNVHSFEKRVSHSPQQTLEATAEVIFLIHSVTENDNLLTILFYSLKSNHFHQSNKI